MPEVSTQSTQESLTAQEPPERIGELPRRGRVQLSLLAPRGVLGLDASSETGRLGEAGRLDISVRPTAKARTVRLRGDFSADSSVALRASVAFSATVAAKMVGVSSRGFAVDITVRGPIDPYDAGAALTAAIMAAMSGQVLDLRADLPGTIKPNGGLVRLTKRAQSRTAGNAHVYVTHRLLTGKFASASTPLAAEQMQVSERAKKRYIRRVEHLLIRASDALERYRDFIDTLSGTGMLGTMQALHRELSVAVQSLNSGHLATALEQAALAYGRCMAIAEIAAWLGKNPGPDRLQARRLIDWLFYTAQYGHMINVTVFSTRGVIRGAMVVGQLLEAFRYRALADAAMRLPQTDERAIQNEILPLLVRGYGAIRSASVLETLLATDDGDRLMAAGALKVAATTMTGEASAQHAYAELIAARLGADKAKDSLAQAEMARVQRLGRDLATSSRSIGVGDLVAVSCARLSILSTARTIYRLLARHSEGAAQDGALHAQRFARIWGAVARAKLGSVPPEARWHFTLAEEYRSQGKYAEAEAYFDAAVLDCRLAVMIGK